mmetsp:Transcript_4981/g.7576  ORF Transcript_4981/g.7576 Transcript_4981/m.7576 type:complete len:410 (-) Transcript_4981:67-1296(-)
MALRSSGGDASEDPLIKAAMEAVDAANEKGELGKGVLVTVDKKAIKKLGKGAVEDFDTNEGLPRGDDSPPPRIKVPPRYKHLKLEDYWYCVSKKVKRKHRKTEGSCGFLELTKMVSSRWKTVDSTDPKVKEWCQKVAEEQLKSYKRDVVEYKEWLDRRSPEGDDDTTSVDETEDYQQLSVSAAAPAPPAAAVPRVPPASMGVGASPFDYGKVQHNFFDPRMSDMARLSDMARFSDMGRFSDLSVPGRKVFTMMPPGPAQSLPPPPPLQFSQDITDRLNKLGGRPMDETERRFAALAEQESRRRIQTEMQMASFVRQRPLPGCGYGPSSGSMLGLGNSSGIGGNPSTMPQMNQGNINLSLSNEEMMAQIMRMRNNLANNNGLGLAGFGVGGKHGKQFAADHNNGSDKDDR